MLDLPEAGSLLQAAEVLSNVSELRFSLLQLPGLSPTSEGRRGRRGRRTTFSLSSLALVKFRAVESIMRSKEDAAGWPLSRA